MIDRDDLARAARETDKLAETVGLEKTLERYGVDLAGVLYVGDQRAIRMALVMEGRLDEINPNEPVAIKLGPTKELIPQFVACWLDGLVNGLVARHDSSHDIPGIDPRPRGVHKPLTVENVDLALLREQRGWVQDMLETWDTADPADDRARAEGLLSLLDTMVDLAEGAGIDPRPQTPKPLVIVREGVGEPMDDARVEVIDMDDWNDELTGSDKRQEMIGRIQRAGYRCVVYDGHGEVPNIQIFPPEANYDEFINALGDDVGFVVYDPR